MMLDMCAFSILNVRIDPLQHIVLSIDMYDHIFEHALVLLFSPLHLLILSCYEVGRLILLVMLLLLIIARLGLRLLLLDLSHINEAGFNDVARLSDAPLVATHSNAHALTPSSRNLTDRQLAMIRDSGGMVGLNFAVSFLRPDGRQIADTGWDPILRQMDYILEKVGENHLGFGSDYDGCTTPAVIGDVRGLPKLLNALSDHGYDRPLLEKLAHGNWLALLDRTL